MPIEQSIPPLFQEGKERLTNPNLALIHVTEIKGVPGVKYDIAVVRDPYHSALGGWRVAPAERLLKDYAKAQAENPEYVSKITQGRDLPNDDTARAGILESFQLAGEMSQKWAGMRSTMRYGMDKKAQSYGRFREELLTNRDAWLDAATMDGGTKGILVLTDKEAYDNRTEAQNNSLLKQHADHMIELNKRKPADAGDVTYYTAPDMGSSEAMMDKINEDTLGRYVACYSEHNGGTGNPSPTTAYGVAYGARAMVRFLGREQQDGKNVTFAIQGAAGEVGHDLVKYLHRNHSRAKLVIADLPENMEKLKKIKADLGATIVDTEEIYTAGTIFVPSGPANQLNHDTLPLMKDADVKAVVGPANYLWTAGKEEQLAEEFRAANIIVAPAPLVNQGGVRSILPQFVEKISGRRPRQEIAYESVRDVEPMTIFILEDASRKNITPDQAFQEIAFDEYAKKCKKEGLIR